MKGILAAKKKPVESWTLADLGIDAAAVGLDAAWTKVVQTTPAPAEGGRAASSPTKTAPDRRLWSTSWPPASTSEREALMSEVLVVAEQVDWHGSRSRRWSC